MIAILSCVLGVLGMIALERWAWRLWKQAVERPPTPELRQPRLVWYGELTPRRRHPTQPPGWVFGEERTEVLGEEPIIDPEQTQPGLDGSTRKLGLFE